MSNNFNLLRLGAALLVLASHSFPLTGSTEPISYYFGYTSGGSIAVAVFFLISGYLITSSAQRRSLSSFIQSRCLRIFPALVAAVFFDIYIIGPLFTVLTLEQYFSSQGTLLHLGNIVFYFYPWLPGTFSVLPNTSVNGSLWTLPLEVLMYTISGVLVATRIRSSTAYLIITICLFCAYMLGKTYFNLSWSNRGLHLWSSIYLYNFLELGFFYFSGACFYLFKEHIRFSSLVSAIIIFAILLTKSTVLGEFLYMASLPYLVFWIAFMKGRDEHLRKLDVSYGIYIFAFPIQQSIIALLGNKIDAYILMLLSIPPVILLATLSWLYIEQPSLSLKSNRANARSNSNA